MKFWITRDSSGLWLHIIKPIFDIDSKLFTSEDGDLFMIDDELFPEITFENSPQQVELKLIKEE